MGKFTGVFAKFARGVRRASTITIDVLFAHPDADKSAKRAEIPSFYLVQTSPTSCQQRFTTPRSSTLISSTGTLVVRNPDPTPERSLRSSNPTSERSLRSADELLPDGEITAESFELQITDEEADNEPDQEEFGNNVEEPSPSPEPLPRPSGFLSTELFPSAPAELNRSTFGYRYDAIKRLPRLEIPAITCGNMEEFGNDARNGKLHRELEFLPSSQRHFFSEHLLPSLFDGAATNHQNSASGSRNKRPQFVVIPAERDGRHLPEPLRVPVRALSQEELEAIRKEEHQLFRQKPLAQRLTGGLNHKKALAEMKKNFRRVSNADFQLVPRKPLAQRLTGGVAYKKALAELKHRERRPELSVLRPSHQAHRHSHRPSTSIPEHPAEAQLPDLWSQKPRSRSLVVRGGNTVKFDGAYHTYMHHRRQARQRRYLEKVWEGWGRKFEKKTTLAQEIAEALADLETFDIKP